MKRVRRRAKRSNLEIDWMEFETKAKRFRTRKQQTERELREEKRCDAVNMPQ